MKFPILQVFSDNTLSIVYSEKEICNKPEWSFMNKELDDFFISSDLVISQSLGCESIDLALVLVDPGLCFRPRAYMNIDSDFNFNSISGRLEIAMEHLSKDSEEFKLASKILVNLKGSF
jgi:hypothetical protein